MSFDNFNKCLYYSAFMSRRLPEFIDPFQLVERRQLLKGAISLEKMQRLASLLAQNDGDAELEIRFDRDEAGLPYAQGTLKTVVQMVCQRCLSAMALKIETEFNLGVVSSLKNARALPDNYEPLVADEVPISLTELIEDEILLALPVVAIHPDGQCARSTGKVMAEIDGAVLERQASALKRKQSLIEEGDSMYNAAPDGQKEASAEKRQNPFAVLEQLKGKLKK
jgi:uncharacterized protein